MLQLPLKPFQVENYTYYTSLSREDFIHKLQRATAPKPELILDSNFSGDFYKGTTSFRLLAKADLYSYRLNRYGGPSYISGTFYDEGSEGISIKFTISPPGYSAAFCLAFSIIGLLILCFVTLIRLAVFTRCGDSEIEVLYFWFLLPVLPGIFMVMAWLEKETMFRLFASEFSLRAA